MKKISNNEIIEMIVRSSSFGVEKSFKEFLEISLKNKFNNKQSNMKKYILGGLSFLTLLIVGAFIYTNLFTTPTANYDKVQFTMKDNGDSGATSGMRLAVDQHDSISDAQEVLSFTPLKPYVVKSSLLGRVETATTFDGSKSQSIYLTFVKGGEEFLKVSQMDLSDNEFYKPEGAKEINLVVKGESISGYYVKYEQIEPGINSEEYLYDGGKQIRSGVVFKYKDISVDVSEFGELSESELVEIVQSM